MRFFRHTRLEEWCLQVIIDNLNSYMHSNAVLQRHLDFLLRLYPEEVFQRYRSSNSITEDRMIWFLSTHNKKIDLPLVTENIVKRIQVVGSAITSLIMCKSSSTENMLNSIVCCIPNIEYLDLSETNCSNRTLLCLQRMCPKLLTLNLSKCEYITDEGMKNLCGHNMLLKNLNIKDTRIYTEGLQYILKEIPSLTCLKYDNLPQVLYNIHIKDFKNIQYNLAELSYERIYCFDPSEIVHVCTFLCPNLRKFSFDFSVNEHVFHLCTRFPKLEEITLNNYAYNMSIMGENILNPLLTISHNIRAMTMRRARISLVTLIENFKNLEYLFLDEVHFTDFHKDDIKTTETKLDTLIVQHLTQYSECPTIYKGLATLLSVSKNVTKLFLNHVHPLPQEICHVILNSMKKLVFVDLSFTYAKLDDILDLFHFPSTRKIYLDLGPNCFSYKQIPILKNALTQNSACTLSWCVTYNDESDDSDSDNDVLHYAGPDLNVELIL